MVSDVPLSQPVEYVETYTLVNAHNYEKSPFFMAKSTAMNGHVSISSTAMLNYQRVRGKTL